MKALTLIRPWGYAFTHCGKDVENRTWKCYLQPGTAIAIHSGSGWDASGFDFLQRLSYNPPAKPECLGGAIIAVARFQDNVTESESKWFFGPIGWNFSDLQILQEPIACKGALGLWNLPAPQLTQVLRQLQAN